jgi:hypothetical protein
MAKKSIPISCALDAGDARAQLGEWADVLRATVVSSTAAGAGAVRMQLDPAGDIGRIVALAQREVACCPFFRFAIEIDTDGVALIASVPPEAAQILDTFAAFVRA